MRCQAQNKCPTEVIFYMYDITITPYCRVLITYAIHYQDANQTGDPKKLRTRRALVPRAEGHRETVGSSDSEANVFLRVPEPLGLLGS